MKEMNALLGQPAFVEFVGGPFDGLRYELPAMQAQWAMMSISSDIGDTTLLRLTWYAVRPWGESLARTADGTVLMAFTGYDERKFTFDLTPPRS